jgi:hypothetical protein
MTFTVMNYIFRCAWVELAYRIRIIYFLSRQKVDYPYPIRRPYLCRAGVLSPSTNTRSSFLTGKVKSSIPKKNQCTLIFNQTLGTVRCLFQVKRHWNG